VGLPLEIKPVEAAAVQFLCVADEPHALCALRGAIQHFINSRLVIAVWEHVQRHLAVIVLIKE